MSHENSGLDKTMTSNPAQPDRDHLLRATLRLTLAEGIGPILFERLVKSFGSAEDVPVTRTHDLRRVDGIGEKTAAAVAAVTEEDIDAELAEAGKHGARILLRSDEQYPTALRELDGSPSALYVRGGLEEADAVAFGIVGSRRCTQYGLEQAERFGQLLGRSGFTIVSGGARGIDTAGHRGSLVAGGRTLAVMGCGLSQVYPPENRKLFDQIVGEGRGALLSELPMRTSVLAGNFPTRNRIISGLSLGVLIVEAARRSGSLITAREAAEQGKTVFAVPGRVDSPLSTGTNDLIRNGAILVQDLDDILEHLDQVGGHVAAAVAEENKEIEKERARGANPCEQSLLDALAAGEATLDELVRKTQLETGTALSAMTLLALKGLVSQKPGNMFVLKRQSQ